MKLLTLNIFTRWLEMYGKASIENKAKASSELFAQSAKYHETPFADPLVGREEIYQYWSKGAQTLTDKVASYEVLALKDNLGIARWQSKFTNIETGNRYALDCIFLVEFDDEEKCSRFREWWHLNEIDIDFDETLGKSREAIT